MKPIKYVCSQFDLVESEILTSITIIEYIIKQLNINPIVIPSLFFADSFILSASNSSWIGEP